MAHAFEVPQQRICAFAHSLLLFTHSRRRITHSHWARMVVKIYMLLRKYFRSFCKISRLCKGFWQFWFVNGFVRWLSFCHWTWFLFQAAKLTFETLNICRLRMTFDFPLKKTFDFYKSAVPNNSKRDLFSAVSGWLSASCAQNFCFHGSKVNYIC